MESVISSREEVNRFLSITGSGCDYGFGSGCDYDYGFGSGDGFGFGDGFGYGYGYGSGSGSGDGSGYGSGYGDGSGDGSGYGDGSGDGSGYGDGDGSGSGDGYGDIKAINGYTVDYIDDLPTIILQVKDNYARGYIVGNDLTFKPCFIAKAGNSFAHGKTLKEAFADAQKKELESMPIEEKIEQFKSTFGSLDSQHTGKEFYDWHHILTGSCTMGRDEFCKSHNIDMDAEYTVRYFLDITKNSYGSDVIQQLIESYNL